jgi:hypothetical protein
MTPADVRRLGETISGFVANIEPPFFLIATDRQRNLVVTEHVANTVAKQLCNRVRAAPGLTSPLTLVVVAADGTVRWAKLTVEAAQPDILQ